MKFSMGTGPTSMQVELVEPIGFNVLSLIDKHVKEGTGMDLATLARIFAQLTEALRYMKLLNKFPF